MFKTIKRSALALMVLTLGLTGTAPVMAADVSLDSPIASKYIWRGLEVNEEFVLQPSLTVDPGKGVTFNLWGNMDLTGIGSELGYGDRTGEFTEIDLTLDYSKSFGIVSAGVGIISYIFPGIGSTTHELYATVSADVITAPSLTVYSDVDEVKGSYFLFGLSHSFEIKAGPLSSVDLGASIGYGSGSYNRGYFGIDKAAPVDAVVSLGLPLSFGSISLTPSATYSYVMDSEISEALDKSGYFFFGLGASLSL